MLSGILVSFLLVTGTTSTLIWYFNFCDTCRIDNHPPDGNSNNETSVWDSILFTLLNGSVFSIQNYEGSNLLLEFASSDCPDCSVQNTVLSEFQELIDTENKTLVLLTLLVDLETQKDLLTYYIDNNVTWTLGSINEGNYSNLNLVLVPTFYFFNETNHEVNYFQGYMSLNSLLNFVNWNIYTLAKIAL